LIDGQESQLWFSDITILETDGIFEDVKEMMKDDIAKHWNLTSDVTVVTQSGAASFVLDFHYDGKIIIVDYTPSIVNALYNSDLATLSEWCQQKGWKRPEPEPDLVRMDVPFWKHFWEMFLIDSLYLDKIFGERYG
jgi:hypothetical protein